MLVDVGGDDGHAGGGERDVGRDVAVDGGDWIHGDGARQRRVHQVGAQAVRMQIVFLQDSQRKRGSVWSKFRFLMFSSDCKTAIRNEFMARNAK